MRFIIPAKTNSTRVPNKNWREFSGGKSLVQICVEKLLPHGEVWVSCEDLERERQVELMGAKFHWRPKDHTDNDCDFRAWLTGTWSDILVLSGEDPNESTEAFGWAQVTTPLFNEHADMLDKWPSVRDMDQFDSMVAVYPTKQYLLDSHFNPIGWGMGPWHTKGQNLPAMYHMPWSFSILTPEALASTGYHIGAKPHWHMCKGSCVDIDTEDDWEYAKFLYEK